MTYQSSASDDLDGLRLEEGMQEVIRLGSSEVLTEKLLVATEITTKAESLRGNGWQVENIILIPPHTCKNS